jgi:hypothetical protein
MAVVKARSQNLRLQLSKTEGERGSYAAKAFGIKTGTLVREARQLCPAVVAVQANHRLYTAYHERILKASAPVCRSRPACPSFPPSFGDFIVCLSSHSQSDALPKARARGVKQAQKQSSK